MTLTVTDEWARLGTVNKPEQSKINSGFICETASPEVMNWLLNNLTKLGIQLIQNGVMPYRDEYKENYTAGALVNYNETTYQRIPNTNTPVPAPDGPNGNEFWTAFAGFARDIRLDNAVAFQVSDSGDTNGGTNRDNFNNVANAIANAPFGVVTTITLNTTSDAVMGADIPVPFGKNIKIVAGTQSNLNQDNRSYSFQLQNGVLEFDGVTIDFGGDDGQSALVELDGGFLRLYSTTVDRQTSYFQTPVLQIQSRLTFIDLQGTTFDAPSGDAPVLQQANPVGGNVYNAKISQRSCTFNGGSIAPNDLDAESGKYQGTFRWNGSTADIPTFSDSGWSMARTGVGLVTVTHNAGTQFNWSSIKWILLPSISATTAYNIQIGTLSDDTFQIRVYNSSGTLVDPSNARVMFKAEYNEFMS